MKRFLSLGCMAFVCACGGSDANILEGGTDDTGTTADTGTGMDGNGGGDTGTDSGMGADGTMNNDAGNLNVAAINCVVLWLDAAKGVTQVQNAVTAWADQTSNLNNAVQAVALRQPTLVANGINGLPTIHFNQGQAGTGNMLTIPDSTSLQWGHNDFSVWIVSRFDNSVNGNSQATGVGVLYSKFSSQQVTNTGPVLLANNTVNSQNLVPGLTGLVSGANVVGVSQGYNDNKARAYGLRRTGNTVEVRVNGSQVGMVMQNGAVDVSATGTMARIGADGDASTHRLNGDVSEVVACKGTMAANDMSALEAYFKAKYNL